MRRAALLTCIVALASVAGTCIPAFEDTTRTPAQGDKLALSLSAPAADDTVAQGDRVTIKWQAANITGESATLSLVAEARGSLARTTLVADIAVGSSGKSGEFEWDTSEYDGAYAIYGRLATAGQNVEERAAGIITINAPPTFSFTAPASNATLNVGQTPAQPLTISWTASDSSASAKIGLDTDSDHGSFDSDPNEVGRNEKFIVTRQITSSTTTDSVSFAGALANGSTIAAGTYTLFALVNDGTNPDLVVDATARITVTVTDPNTATTPKIVRPSADATFLAADASLAIEVDVNQTRDTLVDLKIDSDDTNTNGNEITILSQRFVAANADPFTFDWNGTNSAGGAVRDGVYRILAFVSSGATSPTIVQSTGFVFRRATADTPLIGMLAPAAQVTASAGAILNFRWRDNDPKETETDAALSANIRIVLDKDGDVTTTGDQIEILTGRKAKGDGVNDTFNWQVPDGALEAGTLYTVIATIDRDAADPFDTYSIAPGKVFAPDPTNP